MTAPSDVAIQLAAVGQPTARDLISRKLNEYNDAITGQPDNTALDVYVTDPKTGETLGGLVGRTSLGLFFIDLLYLPESLRKDGLGSKLLHAAEAEAKQRGCARGAVHDHVPGARVLREARLPRIRRSAVPAGRGRARVHGQGTLSVGGRAGSQRPAGSAGAPRQPGVASRTLIQPDTTPARGLRYCTFSQRLSALTSIISSVSPATT